MALALVGDIGGTHARLAVVESDAGGFLHPPATLRCGDFGSLEALLQAYLATQEVSAQQMAVAVAVAGPVRGGEARFTNLAWEISEDGLRRAGFQRAGVLNDFEALALALPRLTPPDAAPIGGPLQAVTAGTVAVLGPGTGFGAAALCRDARGSAVLVTEAGHIGFAPTDEVEVQVWRILARRFGRVSIERILSGPGLVNLYTALCEIEGAQAEHASPAEVLAGADAGEACAGAAAVRFCSILGAVAGDLALAYGAVGGVFLAGGIAPRLIERLAEGGFRAAFEGKGRFTGYLAAIPTRVVTHPFLALLGAVESLRRAS